MSQPSSCDVASCEVDDGRMAMGAKIVDVCRADEGRAARFPDFDERCVKEEESGRWDGRADSARWRGANCRGFGRRGGGCNGGMSSPPAASGDAKMRSAIGSSTKGASRAFACAYRSSLSLATSSRCTRCAFVSTVTNAFCSRGGDGLRQLQLCMFALRLRISSWSLVEADCIELFGESFARLKLLADRSRSGDGAWADFLSGPLRSSASAGCRPGARCSTTPLAPSTFFRDQLRRGVMLTA